MTLIILFGPTGAGKTYIGQLMQKQLGFHFYDGDADLTAEMKLALNRMQPITDAMRDRFFERLFDSIDKLSRRHAKLVVAQTFIKEGYRKQLLSRYPQAKFILIKTKPLIRYRRRQIRADYPWDETYVKKMDALFQAPQIPHQVLTNDSNGPAPLLAALQQLL